MSITTAKVGRRKLFGLLAAVPVVAKEQAAAMGLDNATRAMAYGMGPPLGGGMPIGFSDERTSIMKRLAELVTSKATHEFRRNAKINGMIVDPDIASLRSMSPAVARAIMVERRVKHYVEDEKSWLQKRLENL